MKGVLTVICGACIVGILMAIIGGDPDAHAADIPVTVTVPDEDNYAIFVPDGYEGIIVAGQALPEERVF